MPRRREVPKREILPDPKYGNADVAKFVNVLMTRGKKSVAEHIVYDAFDTIEKKSGKDPLEVFIQALQNVKPDGRSQEPTRRRRELPGAGRSASGAARWRSRCAGSAKRRRSAARSRWISGSQAS